MARTFSGTDRVVVTAAASINDLPASTVFAGAMLLTRTADSANQHLLAKQNGATGWIFLMDTDVDAGGTVFGCLRFISFRSGTICDYHSLSTVAVPLNTPYMVAFSYDDANSQRVRLYAGPLSGTLAEITSFGTASAGTGTAVADATTNLSLGNQNDGSVPSGCTISRVAMWNTAKTLPQLRRWRDALVNGSGRVLGFALGSGSPETDASGNSNSGTVTGTSVVADQELPVQPGTSDFADTIPVTTQTPSTDLGSYRFTRSYARVVYAVNADTVDLTCYSEMDPTYVGSRKVAIYSDGAYVGSVDCATQTDYTRASFTLPGSGTRRVEIWNGVQSRPAEIDPWQGSFAHTVRFRSAGAAVTPTLVTTPTTPAGRIYVLQDSIAGFNTDPAPQLSWVARLRNTYGRSALADVYGGRALWHNGVDAAARTALVSVIAAQAPSHVWISLAANDKGRTYWLASAFQTAYADLLDKLIAALPSARFFAVVPGPTTALEGANGNGETLDAFRTAVRNAASGKARTTTVEGSTLYTTAELDADGVHLTNAGALVYVQNAVPYLNAVPAPNLFLSDTPIGGQAFGTLALSAQSTATSPTGWTVAGLAAGQMARMAFGVERAAGVFSATAQPSGAPDAALGDGYRTAATLNGTYPAGTWTIPVPMLAVDAAGANIRARIRLWRSLNADMSSATEITSGSVIGTTIPSLGTVTPQTSVCTVSLGAVTLTNEFLFLQIAAEIV